MDCILPGYSNHGIFQARILEWGARVTVRGTTQWKRVANLSQEQSEPATYAGIGRVVTGAGTGMSQWVRRHRYWLKYVGEVVEVTMF